MIVPREAKSVASSARRSRRRSLAHGRVGGSDPRRRGSTTGSRHGRRGSPRHWPRCASGDRRRGRRGVKPSCAAMKLTLRVAGGGYTSDDPAIAVAKAPSMCGVAAPEAPHPVAVAVVPLEPGRGKIAELIAAGPEVPGLGDHHPVGRAAGRRRSRAGAAPAGRSRRRCGRATGARSKRKPSTPAWPTKWRRASSTSRRVAGWSQASVLPVPASLTSRAVRLVAEVGAWRRGRAATASGRARRPRRCG